MLALNMKFMQYLGILVGAVYGLAFRFLCDMEAFRGLYDFYNIYSVTFLWILPMVIGIIPIVFARAEVLKSKTKQVLFPVLSVLLFFTFALSSGIEDFLCILIIIFPFLISAAVIGPLATILIKNINSKKLYSIIFIPLLLSPLEAILPNQQESFQVKTEIVINASQEQVWANLLEVPELSDEYQAGLLNYIGVPKPLYSKLQIVDGQEYRVGYFSEGIELYETITKLEAVKFVNFKIQLEKSKLRNLPTDQQLLNSDYFKFDNISYSLKRITKNKTLLTLSTQYSIESKMNFYANFWAKTIIKDFESKLLNALKKTIENQL